MALFALVPVMFLTRGQGGLRALVPTRWHLVALRGVLTTVGSLLAWKAFSILPLAEGLTAILFATPMLVTGLSAARKRSAGAAGRRRAVGFVGC